MIEVKHLVKKYGSHLALNDLSFTIDKGKIYGFLGPNGAGKSTTMNIMTGYIGADSGEVLINGHSILDEPEISKKSIGYLPEIPPLYPDMTVMEYLSFVAELKKIPKTDRKEHIKKVCSMIKLDDVSRRLIGNLSKGYKQRTGLAGAIIGFPDIIILDEPTVGLDPKQIIEIRKLIRELSKNHTVILSSHILAEVQEICDYVLIISKGQLAASGTPDQLEELSHGKDSIELTIKADAEIIQSTFDTIPGIHTVSWTGQKENSCNLIIEPKENAETLCENISVAFASKGIPITKINILKASLEDIFLELTDQSPEEKKGDK